MAETGDSRAARRRLEAKEAVDVAVVGAGVSGLAAARLLDARGARVRVLDDRASALEGLPPTWPTGPIAASEVDAAGLVVLSPGVPRAHAALSGPIARGRLVGEVELASWFVSAPLVGITGTNGKSTVTALIGALLEAAGRECFVGGNLGAPLSELAMAPDRAEIAVVELSSYQLESVSSARFEIGVWLNLQPDHLDRYPSIEAYAAAKARLLERVTTDGWGVANADDPVVRRAAEAAARPVRWFSAGTLAPDAGSWVEGRTVVRGDERYRVDGPGLLGPHNQMNAAAAIEVARLLHASPEAVQAGLTDFRGLEHRLALVHEARGVRWYDDSKATNVSAAVTAVSAMDRPTWLVAGGVDKGGSWAPLVEAARGRVRAVLAIGEASPVVREAFRGAVPVIEVGTLDRAVETARAEARGGEAILLAPACASFDQFESYAARGRRFASLARGQGEEP